MGFVELILFGFFFLLFGKISGIINVTWNTVFIPVYIYIGFYVAVAALFILIAA